MSKFSLIVRRDNGVYELHALHEDLQTIIISGKEFYKIGFDTNFLGFYDWLRASNGAVIGLGIKLDDLKSRKYSDLIQTFFSSADSVGDFKTIFFEDSKKSFDPLSDDADFCDADFCDFSIYRSGDMIAVTFNMPT
jgi:hypothetical protein